MFILLYIRKRINQRILATNNHPSCRTTGHRRDLINLDLRQNVLIEGLIRGRFVRVTSRPIAQSRSNARFRSYRLSMSCKSKWTRRVLHADENIIVLILISFTFDSTVVRFVLPRDQRLDRKLIPKVHSLHYRWDRLRSNRRDWSYQTTYLSTCSHNSTQKVPVRGGTLSAPSISPKTPKGRALILTNQYAGPFVKSIPSHVHMESTKGSSSVF